MNNLFFNNYLNNRKTLFIIFFIVIILVFTLTIAYSVLSATLNIYGNAEVTAASWDIHFDNVKINSGSVEATTAPKIVDSKTINFVVGLKEPGDYYKFTVDVVNEGTIDAMIDSIVKMPELTVEQSKYIRYEIEYIDGNLISSKQLLPKNGIRTISVLVAYRSDVSSIDIPTDGESLSLSFSMVYTQSDETGVEIPKGKEIKLLSGDLDTVGSQVSIGDENFYIISSDKSSVTMLAKYNLYAGGVSDGSTWTPYGDEATGIQDSTMLGYHLGQSTVRKGTLQYSTTNYWYNDGLIQKYGSSYPAYIYDSNSNLYIYVEKYKVYLESMGVFVEEARLIKREELEELGCSVEDFSCSS